MIRLTVTIEKQDGKISACSHMEVENESVKDTVCFLVGTLEKGEEIIGNCIASQTEALASDIKEGRAVFTDEKV